MYLYKNIFMFNDSSKGEVMVSFQKWVWVFVAMVTAPGSIWPQERADSLAAHDRSFTIENCVNRFDMEKTVKTGVGYQYWFIDKTFLDGRTLKMSVVAPHSATHEPHKHAEDEFFFVLEGKLFVDLAEKTLELNPGQGITVTRNVLHRTRAPQKTIMLMVENKGIMPTGD